MPRNDDYAYEIDLKNEQTTAAKILRMVGRNKRVLELGMASGHMSRVMKEQLGCTVVGVEIDQDEAAKGAPYCERVIADDIEQINLEAVLGGDRFDVILCADVLEHLRDPWETLGKVGRFLAPDGKLVISVPNAGFNGLLAELCNGKFSYRKRGLLDGTHLRFFTRREVELLMLSGGFVPQEWDQVLLGAADSEFSESWASLPGEFQEMLRQTRDGEVYQLILGAVLPSRESWEQYLRAWETRENDGIKVRMELSRLSATLQAKQDQIAGLDRELSGLSATLQARQDQISGLNAEIRELHSSTSWKLTRPLRSAVGKIRRSRQILNQLPQAVKRHGGLLPTAKTAVRVLRQRGMRGVKDKLFAAAGYPDWIKRYDTPDKAARLRIEKRIASLPLRPKISILMPVYDTQEKWLRAAIDSVIEQSYPDWELCIADDASPSPHVRTVLKDYAAKDPRIKTVFRTTNGHISNASNSALELATGDYVALLDHDDLLSKDALFHIVAEINDYPDASLLYSDEDKIDEAGQRYDPHFKSDWNADLFYSQNYLCHLCVYRTELVRKVGRFRAGYEGSQDYDLSIRYIAAIEPGQIRHIPRILYHWRAIEGSTALSSDEKDYAGDAGIRALRDHFEIHAPQTTVEPGPYPTTYRVRHPLPSPAPRVSLIVPTRNARELVQTCIESILTKTDYPNYEILLVDNRSDDPEAIAYFEQLHAAGKVKLLHYDAPFNFSAINNFAVGHADGELIGLVNNDIEVIAPGWLSEMVSHAVRPEIGAVGAKLHYTDGRIQHAGVILGLGGVAGHSHKYFPHDHPGYFYRLNLVQNLSAVTAACLVLRKAVFLEVGGLDEQALGVAFNDVDLCLKIREAGYRNLWTPHAALYHHESATRGLEDTPEKQQRFSREVQFMQKRWDHLLKSDPAYSPNLTQDSEDFAIAPIPRIIPR